MREKVQVRDLKGNLMSLDDWQLIYKLKGNQIGKFFSINEAIFKKDIERFGCLEVNSALMMILDTMRKIKGKPVNINSFNRTEEYQKLLKQKGYRTAKTSPHVVKLAADVDTVSKEDTENTVHCLELASQECNIPIRLGYRKYLQKGQTFVHVDVCPYYFGPGRVWHEKHHPYVWEKQITW